MPRKSPELLQRGPLMENLHQQCFMSHWNKTAVAPGLLQQRTPCLRSTINIFNITIIDNIQ